MGKKKDSFKEKIKNLIDRLELIDRFEFLKKLLIFLMVVLVLKLGHLTLIKGNYYKDLSENKRIKEVLVPAPRGNIYDRQGKILAGTKPVYTVSILKDELNNVSKEDKNNIFLKLSRIIETEGAIYNDSYPIGLNLFTYKDKETYLSEEKSPDEKVLDIIEDNDLIKELINGSYTEDLENGQYSFYITDLIINSLKSKGIEIPLNSGDHDENLKIVFDDDTQSFLNKYNLNKNTSGQELLYEVVKKDKAVLRKVLSHPVGRKITYDILKSKNLEDNILLKEIEVTSKEKFIETKANLSKEYENINFDTEAIDDFTEIVNKSTLDKLIQTVSFDAENNIQVPAKKAFELLKANKIKHSLKYKIDETDRKNPRVSIYFAEDYNGNDETAVDNLIKLLRDNNLVKEFVTDEDIKSIAQNVNTQNNINPRISVKDWVYTEEKNTKELYERYNFRDKEPDVEELYEKIKEKFEVTDYSKYDAYNILMIYDKVEKHGDKRYMPLNLAYNISEKTVAKLEENFSNDSGVEVTIQPLRYYPNGELAAHALGYIGKISMQSEIDEYVNEAGYDKNTLIGKTGIEESYEKALKGVDGKKRVQVDNRGNKTEVMDETPAEPGDDVYLTLDLDIQKAAEEAIQKTINAFTGNGIYYSDWGNKALSRNRSASKYENIISASAVVMDVNNGQILAMANGPSYNPNLFSTGITSSDWKSLFPEHEDDIFAPRPLYNTAIQSAIQPGSIFKLNSSLAALEKGIDPNFKVKCNGYVDVGNKRFGCWIWNLVRGTHGSEGVREALRDSCNYYYYSLMLGENKGTGAKLPIKLNSDDIIDTAVKLGLGSSTGVEIRVPQENKGILPDPNIKFANAKVLYRKFLEENAEKYISEGNKFSKEELKEKIDTMEEWMNEGSLPTRTEVIKRLEDLGFDAEVPYKNEKQGFADKIKFDYLNQASWSIADSLNVVMGQGQQAYTPLQMASYMSIFANDGYRYKASLVDKVMSSDGSTVLYENDAKGDRIELKNYKNLQYIREGLHMAAKDGADRLVFEKLPVDVGVKTGTAQVSGKNPVTEEDYGNHAWMIAFAPYDNPQIAVSAVITQGEASSNVGPMMRDIIAEALKLRPKDKKTIDTNKNSYDVDSELSE